MGETSIEKYSDLIDRLYDMSEIPRDLVNGFMEYGVTIYRSDQQNRFSKPMPWIGMYITLASLVCIFAMVADLLHGFKNKKLWFPCKYFTLNAAYLSVIAVAMKLPVDLSTLMPGYVDQAAKLGSMSFMCTIMANFLPSLATMDNNELLSNVIGLVILVITLVVNVFIQILTGVVSYPENESIRGDISEYGILYMNRNRIMAIIYVPMLLMLLMIHVCSALTIVKSKKLLRLKYQTLHESARKKLELQEPGKLTVEKLKQHMSNYWIMAGTGSPQFTTTCFATTTASGVICGLATFMHILLSILTIIAIKDWDSDYKWSMVVIYIIQLIGIILGTIAPVFRCFAGLNFKLSKEWIRNHMKVFKVESYWTQKLSEWKNSSIPFQFRSHKRKVFMEKSKRRILNFCIGLQKSVVVACKIIALIPVFSMVCFYFCVRCLKREPLQQNEDLRCYVLKLQDDPAERTLESISKSMDRLIQKAKNQRPTNLMELLAQSRGFEGVEKFDNHHVPNLCTKEFLDCWSLAVVTLTTIAVSFPNIETDMVDSLMRSVSEGLLYVTLVEENLNDTDEHVCIQKAAKVLWVEVEVYQKWLGNKLKNLDPQVNTTRRILEWYRDTSKNMVSKVVESKDIENLKEDSICKLICGNSMYRIAQTLMLSYQDDIDKVSQEDLFKYLSSMISEILAACLTNLPQVIVMKCHISVIEKWEANVHAAAQLLGETSEIIDNLQEQELPRLTLDELPFIDKWRACLKYPVP